MKGNCIGCLLRYLDNFLFFTNSFFRICCHSQNSDNKKEIRVANGRKLFIAFLQILIFCFLVYDFVMRIIHHYFQTINSIFVGLDYVFDCVFIIPMIIYNLQSNTKSIKQIEEFLYISEHILRFGTDNSSFEKLYWIPYCVFVLYIVLYLSLELLLLINIFQQLSVMAAIRIVTRIVIGEFRNISLSHICINLN